MTKTLGSALREASIRDREMTIYVPHIGGCIRGDWYKDHIINYCTENRDRLCEVINSNSREYVVRLVEE